MVVLLLVGLLLAASSLSIRSVDTVDALTV